MSLTSTEIVEILYKSDKFIAELLPEGITINIRKHDTAKHCEIYLKVDDEKPLLVWYKTNWISSSYEGNETGKIKGLQPCCDFIYPALEKFFEAANHRLLEETEKVEKFKAVMRENTEAEKMGHLQRVKNKWIERKTA